MVRIEKPDPPVVIKATHYSIELSWDHVEQSFEDKNYVKLKFTLQEFSNNAKREWLTVYSGYGTSTVVDNLEPSCEYLFRLCVATVDNQRSEYSSACVVKTTSKLLNFKN